MDTQFKIGKVLYTLYCLKTDPIQKIQPSVPKILIICRILRPAKVAINVYKLIHSFVHIHLNGFDKMQGNNCKLQFFINVIICQYMLYADSMLNCS